MGVYRNKVDDYLRVTQNVLVPATGTFEVSTYDPATGKTTKRRLDVSPDGEKALLKLMGTVERKVIDAQAEITQLLNSVDEVNGVRKNPKTESQTSETSTSSPAN